MSAPERSPHQTLIWLRRRLPISARMRPVLLARAKALANDPMLQPRCRIVSVYEAAPGSVVCHLEYVARESTPHFIVAPLSQVSFGRGHPLTRMLAPLRHQSGGRF